MKNIIKTISLISASSLLIACGGFGDDDFDSDIGDIQFSAGNVNVANYVALGDSLTAGFADGTLYKSGQENSFPNILAQSFSQVGGGTFTQPLMDDDLGGLLFGGMANPDFDVRLVLFADPTTSALGPVRQNVVTPSVASTSEVTTSPIAGLYNNIGVPGAKSFHLVAPSYGDVTGLAGMTANPFFVRFRSAAATSVLADASAQTPTFFTLWIGNNDILGYGTTGGDGTDPITVADDGNPATFTDFNSAYNLVVSTLTAAGSNDVQGVLINIPSITSIPFFTTVPYNAIPLDQASADAANAGFTDYNNALIAAVAGAFAGAGITMTQEEADRRTINYVAGQNAVLILDESLTDLTPVNALLLNFRPATPEDFILLPTSSLLGELRNPADDTTVIGVGAPLTDSEVLTTTEASEIEVARQAYNAIILAAANANPNLIHLDAAAALADVADSDGLNFGTGTFTSEFVRGGAFSLDGIHPTAKGYAVISNLIVDELNSNFSANLPKTNPNDFTTIFPAFPAGFDFSQ